jgi:hypothetical protein
LVILGEYLEVGVGVAGTGLTVVEELPLDGKPDLSIGVITNNVLEVDGDGVEEPRKDDVVYLSPTGNGRGNGVKGDVVVEGVAL